MTIRSRGAGRRGETARGRRTRFGAATVVALSAAWALLGCAPAAAPSPVGQWTAHDDRVWLELAEDGSFTGSDGCNRLGGEWTENGNGIVLEQAVTTLVGCLDADDWLAVAANGAVDGDTMVMSDSEGRELGALERD